MVVGIKEDAAPHLVCLVFLQTVDVVFKVDVSIKAREVVFTILEDYQYLVAIVKLAQQSSVLVVVQAIYIRIVPYLSAT